MDKQNNDTYDIMEVCLLAGKIMLRSGAETSRVEDTMTRIANAFGVKESQSHVTPTGIIFSIDRDSPTLTKLLRITDRTTDLHKVALVNNISRKIADGEVSLAEAFRELKEIEHANLAFPLLVQVFAAAMLSGCFLIMFKGTWQDFFPAFLAGGIGYYSFIYLHELVPIRFFSEFASSVVIGLLSFFSFISAGDFRWIKLLLDRLCR